MAKQILLLTRTRDVSFEEMENISKKFDDYHVLFIPSERIEAKILNCEAEDIDIEKLKETIWQK